MTAPSTLPEELVRRAARRRAGLAVFETIAAPRTALLALNMQNAWLAEHAPFDAGQAAARALPKVNRLAKEVRDRGGLVIWLKTTTGAPGAPDYWSTYFDHFVGPDKRPEAVDALLAGNSLHDLGAGAAFESGDLVLDKHRFSAFLRNPYDLDAMLRARSIDTLIVAGTATNICCESTAREAMMRDYFTFMPHDASAAPSDEAHATGLRSVAQVFADIRATEEIIGLMQ